MKSTDRGFSIEGLIGTALTLLALLINPDDPGWRIVILVSAGLLFLNAVRKSQWAERTSPILTLNGESFPDDTESFLRKLSAYTFVILGITIFGFVTWPSKQFALPGDAVVLSGPVTSQIQFHPTPKGILPNVPDVQPGTDMKVPIGHAIGAPGKDVKPMVPPSPPTRVTATAQ